MPQPAAPVVAALISILAAAACPACHGGAAAAPGTEARVAAGDGPPARATVEPLDRPVEVPAATTPAFPGLRASLVVRGRRLALDPRLEDPAILAALRACADPVVARALPSPTPRGWSARSAATPPPALDPPCEFPVEPPVLDAAWRLTNQGPFAIGVYADGDLTYRRLRLEGPGALLGAATGDTTEIFIVGRLVRIEPGASVELPVGRLAFGDRADNFAAFLTAPGRHVLELGLDTQLVAGPALDGNHAGRGRTLRLRAAPFELVVEQSGD